MTETARCRINPGTQSHCVNASAPALAASYARSADEVLEAQRLRCKVF
jgi:hypothetical protein